MVRWRSTITRQWMPIILLATPCTERMKHMPMSMPTAHAEKKAPAIPDSKSDARLELITNAAEFKKGSEAYIELRLRNLGSADLWINQRLLVNAAHVPQTTREVWLEVKGPEHALLPFRAKIKAGQAETKYFKILRPKEQTQIQFDLARYFDLSQPGTYQVTAYYKDGSTVVPKAPVGAKHLISKLCSNTLEIVVH